MPKLPPLATESSEIATTSDARPEIKPSPHPAQNGASKMEPSHKPQSAKPRLAEQMKLMCGKPIEKGPPLVYKLPLKSVMKDKGKGISKCHIGSPDPTDQSPEKVIMVVGATGAGKSTLINGMANYVLGVEWEDDFRFKLITDESTLSQSHTQTNWVTSYTFLKMEGSPVPYTLTVIDTPGFGHTQGLKRDKEITSQIKQFFSISEKYGGIDHLDGIGLVTQATPGRLIPTHKYIFDSILAIFGKDIASSIYMMVTFADGGEPPVLAAVREAQIPFEKAFKFNNSALFTKAGEKDGEDAEDDEDFAQMFWKMGLKSIKKFFDSLSQMEPCKSLQLTKEVLREYQRLEANILRLENEIRKGLSHINVLQQEWIDNGHEEAMSGKTMADSTTSNLESRMQFISTNIQDCVQTIKQSLRHLDEIALKPNPLTKVEYIELLIQEEKDQAKGGWQQRVLSYEEIKQQAILLEAAVNEEEITKMLQKPYDKSCWEKFVFQ